MNLSKLKTIISAPEQNGIKKKKFIEINNRIQ